MVQIFQQFTNMSEEKEESADTIINNYKAMTAECQQIASKIQELNQDKDEHRIVIDNLKKLDDDRKAFRMVGGVLVERKVKDALPDVTQNFDGVSNSMFSKDVIISFCRLLISFINLRQA